MTPSAHALGSVLAAGPGFEAPGLEAFYPHPLWHFTLLSVNSMVEKTNRYTSIEARQALMEGKRPPGVRELIWKPLRASRDFSKPCSF